MGEEAPKKKNTKAPASNMLSWITSKAKGVTVTTHHLEGVGFAAVASIAIFYVANLYWKRKNRGPYHRSQSLGALHGGKVAMQRILEDQHARIDPSVLRKAEAELTDLLAKDKLNFYQLESVVMKLEMSGKEETAVKLLSEAHEKAINKGQYHEAYELDMLIVEMLIYKGDYDVAFNRKCLSDQEISDARRPLYLTVIRIMKEQNRLAEESWKEFKEIRSNFQWPDGFPDESTHAEEVIYNFDKFAQTVNFLKKEINDIRKNVK